jgi:hypothetical protein
MALILTSGSMASMLGIGMITCHPCQSSAKGAPHGIAAILVDCTLMTHNKQIAKAEERIHSNYDIGQAHTITNGSQIKLGEVQIGRDPDGKLRISHQAHIENLSNIKANLHNDIASVRCVASRIFFSELVSGC